MSQGTKRKGTPLEGASALEPRKGSPEDAAHHAGAVRIVARRKPEKGRAVVTEYECQFQQCRAHFASGGGFQRGFNHYAGKEKRGPRVGKRVR